MSSARHWHLWVGLAFLVLYLLGKHHHIEERLLLHPLGLALLIPALYLGTALPDWDIRLLGIGAHRNPIFHSAILYFLAALLWRLAGGDRWIGSPLAVRLIVAVQVGLCLGLSSHMVMDIIQYGDVRWLTGATLGKLWLAVHAVLLAVAAWTPRYAHNSTFSLRRTQ